MTEQQLIQACANGKRDAQRELYDRTNARIYGVLLRLSGNSEDAFDLAQETYLKAFAKIGQFDGRASVATWLYRIAVNEALQFRRSAARSRDRLRHAASNGEVSPASDNSTVKLDLNDAMASLEPTERAMLLLRYQEGLDYKTIAVVVDCAAGTVASRLNRARAALRELLKESYAGAEENGQSRHPRDVRQVSSDG